MSERKTKTLDRSIGYEASVQEVEEAIAKCRADGHEPVEFVPEEDYGSLRIILRYKRPETDGEMEARERNEAQWAKQAEARERAEYEALKKKFEGQ